MSCPEIFKKDDRGEICHVLKYKSMLTLGIIASCALPYLNVFDPIKQIMHNFSKFYDMLSNP